MFQISTPFISHHTEGLVITALQVVALTGKTRKVSVQVVGLQTGLPGITKSSEEEHTELWLCSRDSDTHPNPPHLTRQDWLRHH